MSNDMIYVLNNISANCVRLITRNLENRRSHPSGPRGFDLGMAAFYTPGDYILIMRYKILLATM